MMTQKMTHTMVRTLAMLFVWYQSSKKRSCTYCKEVNDEIHNTTRQCSKCIMSLCFRDRDCSMKWHEPVFLSFRKEWKHKRMVVEHSRTSCREHS